MKLKRWTIMLIVLTAALLVAFLIARWNNPPIGDWQLWAENAGLSVTN